jgi:hypothetical protein
MSDEVKQLIAHVLGWVVGDHEHEPHRFMNEYEDIIDPTLASVAARKVALKEYIEGLLNQKDDVKSNLDSLCRDLTGLQAELGL